MIDINALVLVIAKHVRKRLGEKSLNELIAAGIAVYTEVIAAVPKSRALKPPTADPELVAAVLDELAQTE
jgi:hypothetical protein